jgi:hypothetical protein
MMRIRRGKRLNGNLLCGQGVSQIQKLAKPGSPKRLARFFIGRNYFAVFLFGMEWNFQIHTVMWPRIDHRA